MSIRIFPEFYKLFLLSVERILGSKADLDFVEKGVGVGVANSHDYFWKTYSSGKMEALKRANNDLFVKFSDQRKGGLQPPQPSPKSINKVYFPWNITYFVQRATQQNPFIGQVFD